MNKPQNGTKKDRKVKVRCYSGHIYADRPKSFILESIEHQIDAVIKEWQEPGERHFLITVQGDDRKLELCYYEQGDRWTLLEIK